ncbi:MAG TPA: ABC transporter permease, partial [Polyangiaceae bacterium]|nr:ABC transporter permease [Polyangiaceae bacterium]
LVRKGLLVKYVVASLFRVTWGFSLACVVGIPLGLVLGWFRTIYDAIHPLLQLLRPISPIAWIPLAILWFGVSDGAPVFLIFLASVFPIATSTLAAVQQIQPVYLRAARNFGLSGWALIRVAILPAALPQVITAVRIALGVAWLVVVAAEMIAVNSGLGYLIIDARNAGRRYDLVVAGMFVIGVIGLVLDCAVRRLSLSRELSWANHDHGN